MERGNSGQTTLAVCADIPVIYRGKSRLKTFFLGAKINSSSNKGSLSLSKENCFSVDTLLSLPNNTGNSPYKNLSGNASEYGYCYRKCN